VERWWLLSRRRRDAAQAVLALSNCLTRCYGHDGSSRSRVLLITVLGLRHTSGAVRILLLCSSLAPAVVCSAPAAASQQHTVSRQHQSTTGRLRFQGRCTRPAWRHHCAACLCIPLPHAHHHHRCLCFALPPHRPHAMSRVARAVTAVLPPRPPVGTAASAAACRMSYSTQHANHEHGQARCRSLDQAVAAHETSSTEWSGVARSPDTPADPADLANNRGSDPQEVLSSSSWQAQQAMSSSYHRPDPSLAAGLRQQAPHLAGRLTEKVVSAAGAAAQVCAAVCRGVPWYAVVCRGVLAKNATSGMHFCCLRLPHASHFNNGAAWRPFVQAVTGAASALADSVKAASGAGEGRGSSNSKPLPACSEQHVAAAC
jgi:hypothetical protein